MKNIFTLIFVLSIFAGCKNNTAETSKMESKSIEDKLIGEWVALSESENVSLIFNKTKHAILIVGKSAIGGENFTGDDGTKMEYKFEVDENQNPMSLDLVMYEFGTESEKYRIKGIFRFLTNKKIEYRMSFDGKGLTEFDPNDKQNTAILDKKDN